MKTVRAELCIKGRVQGVFFRQSTKETAISCGVTGWVRNLPNGDVEAVLEGQEDAVRKVIEWCKCGPPAARVDEVQVEWNLPSNEFIRFSIR